jgi:hypothetical protein
MNHSRVDYYRQKAWDGEKPDIPEDPHNWFAHSAKVVMNGLFTDQVRYYCELGVWTGHSLKHACKRMPNATIFAVDHWSADPVVYEKYMPNGLRKFKLQDRIPTIYDRFLANLWDYRERVVPLRMLTDKGLNELRRMNVPLDMVYIDACHQYEFVNRDIEMCMELFPNAVLFGDDFGYGQVRRAVLENAQKHGLEVYANSNRTWLINRNLEKVGVTEIPSIFVKISIK